MSSSELTQSALALPEADRLELARKLIESVELEADLGGRIAEGVRRIEDVATGRVAGLSNDQFQAAVR